MKFFTYGLIFIGFFCFVLPIQVVGQTTTLYSEDFGDPASFSGENGATGDWTPAPEIYWLENNSDPSPGSGGGNALAVLSQNGHTLTNETSISTQGYSDIVIRWSDRWDMSGSFAQVTIQYGDGSPVGNEQSMIQISNGSSQWTQRQIQLTNADNLSNLRFFFRIDAFSASGEYYIDDIEIEGIPVSNVNYFNIGNSDLSNLLNWGTETDGTGSNPSSFSENDANFNISNGANNIISNDWTVDGTSSKVLVRNGAGWTIPSTNSYNGNTTEIEDGGTLQINNSTIPTLNNLGATSLIVYGGENQAIYNTTYGNLEIDGPGIKTIHTSLTINGDLTLTDGELAFQTTVGADVTVNGNVSYVSGSITGSSTANLKLNSTTGDDDLNFTAGFQTLRTLTVNKTGASVNLGSDLTISAQLSLTAGSLLVGSNTLTLNGTTIGGASPQLITTSSSNLVFGGNSSSNVFIPASVTTLNNLVINYTRSTGVHLSDNIQIEGALTVNANSYFDAGAFEISGAGSANINGTVYTAHAQGFGGTFDGLSGGIALDVGSTIDYNAGGVQSISETGGEGYGNLTLSNAGEKSAGSATIIVRNNFTVSGSATLGAGSSTFQFTGQGARTLPGEVTFNNLVLTTPAATTSTTSLAGDLNLTGNLSVGEDATLVAADDGTIGIDGDWTVTGAFDHAGNSLVTFTGDAQSLASGGSAFYNLTLSGTGIKSLADDIATGNDLIIEQGITLDPAAFNAAISGTLNNSGTFGAGSGNISISGVLQNSGTFSAGGGYLTLSDNLVNDGTFNAGDGTIIFDGATAISGIASDITVNHVETTGALTAPPVLNVQGNWNAGGTFNPNSGLVVFNGSSAQATQGATAFYNLTLDNSAGLTFSGDNHDIINTLKLQTGTLFTSDALTLVSNISGTARLAKVESGADLSGLVTVQRYIHATQPWWRHCGVSVEGQTLGDWIPENHIKLSSPSSAYFHSEPVSGGEGWFVPSSLSENVNLGQGVKLWLWHPNFTQGTRTLENTGTIYWGPFDFNITKSESGFEGGGWNFLANPYPCEIDWDEDAGWTKSGLNGTIYIYDSEQSNYITYNTGTGGVENGIIAPGQAFFIKADQESPQLIVNEDAKVESGATFYRKKAIDKELTLTLRNTENKYDQAFIRFMPEASNQYDYFDGEKLYGANVNISSKTDDGAFAINSLADELSGGRLIPLEVKANKTGKHTLSFNGLDTFDPTVQIRLTDHKLDSAIDVRTTPEYAFEVQNLYEEDRFEILMGEPLTLSLGNVFAATGESGAIPVTVENYQDVLTTQFTVNWDPADLEFINVTDFGLSSISSTHFNTSSAESGHFTFSWDDASLQGVSLDQGDTLFVINMQINMPMGSETEVSFGDTPLPVEVSDITFTTATVAVKNGKISSPEFLKIAGTIKNNAGLPLKNAEVLIQSGDKGHRVSTDVSGGFEIEIAQDKTYTLTPETVEEAAFSGLSTIDIALIRRHILNLKNFDDPVQLLAADLNQSKTVSTLDIAVLRSIILGNEVFQPKWRFVPEAHLSDGQIFDADTFLTVNATTSPDLNINFRGVKLGDVNDSWDGSELRRNDQDGLELIIEQEKLAEKRIEVPVRVRNFEKISAYQFTVSWDPSVMKLNEITENPYNAYFGVSKTNEGRLSVAWDHDAGESLDIADLSELMVFEFTTQDASNFVQITSDITPILFAGYNLKPVSFSIFNVAENKDKGFSFSVYPNPAVDKANFNLFAPEAGSIEIEIVDLAGKRVKELRNVNVSKGFNHFELSLGNEVKNRSAGLLIYKIKYGKHNYFGKLLLRQR